MNQVLAVVSAFFYLAAALLAGPLRRGEKRYFIIPGVLAAGTHAMILYQTIFTDRGINLGLLNAASLITWVITLLILIMLVSKPVENLLITLFPLAAAAIGLAAYFPGERLLAGDKSLGFQIHLISSILAYSLLCLSAFQALFLAFQDYQLHHKHPLRVMKVMPPLQIMENFLLQTISAGFLLLSISLLSGMMFLQNMFAQHVAHHTVLSIIAWVVFAVLLWGRWRHGWRGRTVIRWNLLGFLVLMLAYFGSKLVLEIFLNRY